MEGVTESYSMTPPMSPTLLELSADELEPSPPKRPHLQELDSSQPVCFACKGEVTPNQLGNFHADSILHRGRLDSLLNGTLPDASNFQTLTAELFGFHFVPQLSLQEDTSKLFYLARQQYDRIESLCGLSFGSGSTSQAADVISFRHNIRHFFDYIQWYSIRCVCDETVQDVTDCILHHICSLLLYIGRLSDLPHHVSIVSSGQIPNSHALVQVHLDIYWSIIETLHLLSVHHPTVGRGRKLCSLETDGDEDYDLFSQCVQLFLADILTLAIPKHNKLTEMDYLSKSPFPCTCIQEFCTLLVHLLQHRQAKLAKQSFWGSLFPILESLIDPKSEPRSPDREIDSNIFILSISQDIHDPVGFCWWIILHSAHHFKYDHFGIYSTGKAKVASNYLIVMTLLKKIFSPGHRLTEGRFRVYMRCCVHLADLWEPNIDILVLLWNHFYRRLNDQFHNIAGGVRGLATMSKTALHLFEQCKGRCESNTQSDDSSFDLFLHLLAVHLSQPDHTGPNAAWKQMKGRIYSKFHSRRMLELTEVGLCNFTGVFLTLASVTELEDVASKLCELYGSLSNSHLESNRRLAVWRGMFALVLVYLNRNLDVSVIADRIVKDFNDVSSKLSQPNLELSCRHDLWHLVTFYMDSVQEILECSPSLRLGEYKLISPSFKSMLMTGMENELRSVLTFLQAVLTRHRLAYKKALHQGIAVSSMTQYRNLSDCLWRGFYEFVKSHSCSETPPPVIADVAAGFTFLAMDMPPSIHAGVKEDFQHCFLHFGCSEAVQPSVSCRYLGHLLPNRPAMEKLALEVNNAEGCLVRAWFRCCWTIPPGNQLMQELTRLVLKLETMATIFSAARLEPADSYDAVVIQFTEALGKKYSLLPDLRSKIEFQEYVKQYFGDVPKYLSTVLKNPVDAGSLSPAYILAGNLVKNCCSFLYIRSRPDCLLPILLERMIFPRVLLTPNKPVPPALLGAIRHHLDLFVQGLGRLDYRRDPYVQRKLKDIVQFLPRFPVKPPDLGSGVSMVHPLVSSLSESCGRPVKEEASTFRRYVLELVLHEFLQIKGITVHPQAAVALTFLQEVFNATILPVEIAKDSPVVLSSLLNHLLLCDSHSVRQPATNVLQAMMEACQRCQEQVPIEQLAPVVGIFVDQHLRMYQSRALRVLEPMCLLYPSLMTQLIPKLTQAIKEGEAKRGVGIDKQLRMAYFSLLKELGEKGKEEKLKLIQESS